MTSIAQRLSSIGWRLGLHERRGYHDDGLGLDMDDADEANADSPRARLYQVVARLLHLHEGRDTLARKNAGAERDMGTAPADLLITLGETEDTLIAVEAEVLEAAYAVIAADRLSSTVQRDEDDT